MKTLVAMYLYVMCYHARGGGGGVKQIFGIDLARISNFILKCSLYP